MIGVAVIDPVPDEVYEQVAGKLRHNHAKRTERERNEADKQAVPALEKAQRALQLKLDE